MGKVELLSPAGNFDALKGAINAGADAVYLGGKSYGARAYADNFTADEICEGIHYAHVFGRKIYLTVNTLIKEKELDDLYHFMLPFYEKGLDGVIVQDMGVLRFLRHYFPGLLLHASTQMTITGPEGAALLKEEGISRIVPARELSLDELISLKQRTGVEIEAFIHGAMCYCYSGQCLFSSLLGGRSGNRGRCAQPCRLPYQVQAKSPRGHALKTSLVQSEGQSCYPLSMKDMCTIDLLPKLIEAGIDSFKIEGRMKDPAYAAGVTAVYRKYIDRYYQVKENFQVSKEDQKLLASLYIRSETEDGYYQRRNGRKMISLSSPAYSHTDEALLTSIRQKYIDTPLCHSAKAKIYLKAGERAELTLEMITDSRLKVCVAGEQAQEALRQPLSKSKIEEQLKKSGNSLIRIEEVTIDGAENIFMPISSLNELRRSAILALEKELVQAQMPKTEKKDTALNLSLYSASAIPRNLSLPRNLHASVMTSSQLKAALEEGIGRIYVDYGLLDKPLDLPAKTELYGVAPYIVREGDKPYLERLKELLLSGVLKGVLVRNLESAAFFSKNISADRIVLDANLYIWNREALRFWESYAGEFYLPVECNVREWRELLGACQGRKLRAGAVIYGRLPMMITANCVRKTMGKCGGERGITLMEDRYGKSFPVYSDCLCCYNVIYNSVPLSLHRQFPWKIPSDGDYRLDFTLEQEEETRKIIRFFHHLATCSEKEGAGATDKQAPVFEEYTTGHFKRGVE